MPGYILFIFSLADLNVSDSKCSPYCLVGDFKGRLYSLPYIIENHIMITYDQNQTSS
jgi:hypothetical protein